MLRVRKLDQNGDYSFGCNFQDFWKDDANAVAQILKTRLLLFTGEWWLDRSEGMPWGGFPLAPLVVAQGKVISGGHVRDSDPGGVFASREGTQQTRDLAIRIRVLTTPGVVQFISYSSQLVGRQFNVKATVQTIFSRDVGFVLGAGTTIGTFTLDVTPLDSGTPLG
jgi:hypothetical protein